MKGQRHIAAAITTSRHVSATYNIDHLTSVCGRLRTSRTAAALRLVGHNSQPVPVQHNPLHQQAASSRLISAVRLAFTRPMTAGAYCMHTLLAGAPEPNQTDVTQWHTRLRMLFRISPPALFPSTTWALIKHRLTPLLLHILSSSSSSSQHPNIYDENAQHFSTCFEETQLKVAEFEELRCS